MRTTHDDLLKEYRARGWWGEQRLHDLFDAHVRAIPERLAVADPPNRDALVGGAPQRLTYAALGELSDGYALRLLELGLRRDDILITQLPNIVEYVRCTSRPCGSASSSAPCRCSSGGTNSRRSSR